MNAIAKSVGTVDRFQQRWRFIAFPVAVWKKFNDDRAGNLAALIAYYGFIATFPLLLIFVTVLDIVLRNDPQLRATLIDSALAHYPVVGDQITRQLGSVSDTGLPLAVGIVVLLLGARGVAGAMSNALYEIWGIPRDQRPDFPLSWLFELTLVLTVGIGFVVTTTLSGVAAGAGHLLTGAGGQVAAVAVSLVLNVGAFWLAFRIASAFKVPWHDLRHGAAIAAIVWQVLQVVGGYVISHQLQRASSLYGTFGVVLGLLAWLYLQAMVTLYAAEVDVVLVRRLWPRTLRSDSQEPEPRDEKEASHHGQRAA
jgi:membrane protein